MGFSGRKKNVARRLDGWILSKNFLRQVGMFNFFAVCRFRNLKKVKKFFHKKTRGVGLHNSEDSLRIKSARRCITHVPTSTVMALPQAL